MESRWEEDASSGTHLFTMVHLVPPIPISHLSPRRSSRKNVNPTIQHGVHGHRSQVHPPRRCFPGSWTRGGPSKDQPSLWRCWLQTEVTFRTGSGFSAGPRDGSEMRMADLGFLSMELLHPLIRWDAYTWNHHSLVGGPGPGLVVSYPQKSPKSTHYFVFPNDQI